MWRLETMQPVRRKRVGTASHVVINLQIDVAR